MKASAIYVALAIVLPAVLALPQSPESVRDGLLRGKGKGKDGESEFALNKRGVIYGGGPKTPTTVFYPKDHDICRSDEDCGFGGSCVSDRACTLGGGVHCPDRCSSSSSIP